MITKSPILNCCRILVDKFCPNCDNWPREMKIAKKLLYICPDIEAWQALKLPFAIHSLSYFLTEVGKVFIPKSQKNPHLLDLDSLKPKRKSKKKKVDLDPETL